MAMETAIARATAWTGSFGTAKRLRRRHPEDSALVTWRIVPKASHGITGEFLLQLERHTGQFDERHWVIVSHRVGDAQTLGQLDLDGFGSARWARAMTSLAAKAVADGLAGVTLDNGPGRRQAQAQALVLLGLLASVFR